MADVSYVPGTRIAVAGEQCWALVETPPDAPAVARTWQQVGQGAAADALLAGLLADGLDGTPGFTLLAAGDDGHYRLFCRGTVSATVVTAAPAGGARPGGQERPGGVSERIDGAGLLTWREQVVPADAERIFLGQPPGEAELRLPAASGVLLAGCVIVELTALAARDTVPYGTGWPAEATRHDTGVVPAPGGEAPGGETAADRGAPAPAAGKQKTIVFFPDTITITPPGHLAGHGDGAPADSGAGWPEGPAPVTAQGPAVPALPSTTGTGAVGTVVSPMVSAVAGAAPDGTVEVLPGGVQAPGRPGSVSLGAVNPGAVNPDAVSPGAVTPAVVNAAAVHPGAVHAGAVGQVSWPGRGPGQAGEYELAAGSPPARTVADVPVRFAHGAAGTGRPGGPGSPDGHAPPAGYMPPAGYLPPDGGPQAGPPWGNGFAGQVGQAPVRYPEVPPSAQPWSGPPGPGRPWEPPAGPPRPWEPPAGQPQPWEPDGPARSGTPSPARPGTAPAPAAGLIDVPSWLAGPAGPGSPGPGSLGPGPGGGTPGGPSAPLPVPPAPMAPQASAGPGESDPTVYRGDLSELAARTAPPDRIGPVVPALICPSGHVNPPSGAACRRCGAALPHDPVLVPRPVLGVLRLSLGDVIALDRGVVMGRNPRTDFAGGGERPHVVKLPSADGDISRTHLRVTLDGWHVLVTDLNSTNGTLVTLPGRDPQQLRPGEPVPIQPGTVVALADGIDFRYEVTE